MHAEAWGVDRLALELLDVLWSYYLLKHHTLGSEDPVEAMRRFKIMALLSDDVLLRLAKLGETNRDTWNFAQVLKRLRNLTPARRAAIRKQVTRYQTLIGKITKHRNRRIAHVTKLRPSGLEPPVETLSAIRLAVALVDELTGARNCYEVCGLDLRRELPGENGA